MTKTTQLMQAFAFDSHAVRVVQIDGQPWFVARDICECLGIDRTAIRRLDDDERGVHLLHTTSGDQEMAVINESGLYTLILRSNGATTPGTPAHTFRKWVTAEVLPALRQTGRYAMPGAALVPDDKLAQLLAGVEKLLAVLPAMMDVLTQMASAMPKMLAATHPQRGKPTRRRMHMEDVGHIQALRAKGYTLDDLVLETEFSQSQCWSVISGRYKVLDSGRVSIDLRSDAARAADAAAKAERAQAPETAA